MKRMCKRQSGPPSKRPAFPNEPRRTRFASHLLQANFDIRTIQELLGNSDVSATMIYAHTVRSVTSKEAKSPLDFTAK
jgi:site-specific recombinase XerC